MFHTRRSNFVTYFTYFVYFDSYLRTNDENYEKKVPFYMFHTQRNNFIICFTDFLHFVDFWSYSVILIQMRITKRKYLFICFTKEQFYNLFYTFSTFCRFLILLCDFNTDENYEKKVPFYMFHTQRNDFIICTIHFLHFVDFWSYSVILIQTRITKSFYISSHEGTIL